MRATVHRVAGRDQHRTAAAKGPQGGLEGSAWPGVQAAATLYHTQTCSGGLERRDPPGRAVTPRGHGLAPEAVLVPEGQLTGVTPQTAVLGAWTGGDGRGSAEPDL